MLEVSGLHFNSQVAAVDVGVSNVLVVYADNVAAELCDDPGYAEELTRLVEQLDVEQGGSAGLNKAAVNDSGQDSNIDVAAGDEAYDLLALYGYLIEHYSRNGNCASALCDELLLLDERQDSRRDLVVGNGNDLVNVLAAYIKGMLTGFLYLDSVRDGGNIVKALDLAVSYGVHHAGSSGGLYAVNLDFRIELLYGICNAGDKSAAADRNYDSVNVRELLKHLQTDGALTCDNVLVVERVNEGVALLIAELESLRVGVVVNALYQADLCAVGLGSLYLRDRRAVGQADERLDTGSGSRESNALRVVSCGACLLYTSPSPRDS